MFKQLDIDNKEFLSLKDFITFLNGKYVVFEEESLRRFIHNFDKDSDFAIDYNEFLNIVLSKKNEDLRKETEQRKPKDNEDKVTQTIEQSLIKLLKKELEMVKVLAGIADELKSSKDFTTYESFLAIVHDEKYITEENLGKFLKEHNVNFEEKDTHLLMFRIDSDADGRISYEEFLEIFFPYKNILRAANNSSSSFLKEEFNSSNIISSSPLQSTQIIYDNNKISNQKNNDYMCTTQMKSPYEPLSPSQNKQMNSNVDINYRANLRTYTTPKRREEFNDEEYKVNCVTNVSPQRKQSPSCYFERNKRFSPNRTDVLPSPKKNSPNLSPYRTASPLRECTHCCCNSCCCCCVEKRRRMNLFQLLKDIVEKDAMIESIKESLAFCTDANLPDLFDFFDYSRKNAIGPMDLAETLKELGIFLSICDLKILYKRFDKDLDGRFDYDEFCDLILPRKYSIAKLMNERYPPSYFLGFCCETKKNLSALFNAFVDAEKSNDRLRQILSSTPNCSPYDSFNMIKKEFNTEIYKEDLEKFMEQNGKYMTLFESELLMQRLDKNQDGVVSYDEYLSEIAVKC